MIPKFRAWNTETKEIEVFNTYEEISELFLALSADDGFYSVMQSTGLHDKNGKEIFEGDILTDGHTLGVLRNHQTLGFYMVDEKGKESFLSDTVDIEGFEEAKEFMKNSIETIGNIYENPELLEV